ncbi:50S ribosomal protein L24 [Mariluticola halotolerans]|uniref:50S ribosomal protein L24 n=1 Tax=Mariluticola halotolerans TaxID=2909283 RepID=UPI0026E12B07|nr:50S ribosomal protein L24 [Mariluticola halotolerans]UJQ95278.1 50S ribosomal protein L24 [Mariluticola halotolerans]
MAAKIKKGDKVVVLTGKDKGRTGEVLQVLPEKTRAFVQGINQVRRHTKQTADQEAGIYTKEASIHLSNLALVDPKDNKPTRVGFEIKDGAKVRVAKRSGEKIDG